MRKHKSFLALYVLIILVCAISANVHAQSMKKVEISDNFFQPDIISASMGTTVIWTNDGAADHTVTSDNSAFHSGYIVPGGQFSHLFDKQGDYAYHCNIHPFMRGMVHVVPKPAPASASISNAYQSAVSTDAHITNPQEYDIQNNPPSYLYFRDQEQAVPYYQYQAYTAHEEGNFLWVQGTSSWSQYATVPQGTLTSLIAATPTEGNGYLYETYPDGHTIKNYYYFFPYSQVGINLDTIGQHKLFFSKGDQMSNSIVIDVTGSNQLSNVRPEIQKTSYPQPNYVQPSHQPQSKPQAKETTEGYNSFLESSIVKMDSNGRLTSDGLRGTDYDLQPSNTNILTRGLLYNGISYILVANPNSVSDTVIVDPGIGNWNIQSAQAKYGNLMIAKANNLLQITIPARQSGLIVIQPQKKRYSFSIGPKPSYSFNAGPKPEYSFRAGPKPQYSFRAGY